jgi:acetoin utilization deacetylase AcuC-like enzyme
LNVPLGDIGSKAYLDVFKRISTQAFEEYKPDAVVLLCGADGLYGDRLGGWSLSVEMIGECVKTVLDYNIPTMLLV